MLTTHSHEVVCNAHISQLRVIRQTGKFTCELYDLCIFKNSLEKTKPEVLDFYDFFYTINFPDLIFADKIIMYEGDTERMLIKSIICLEEFKSLGNQYVSFVQVGGAYAHMYFPIVNYLGIKAIILTDLDYKDTAKTKGDVLSSSISNSAIMHFYKESHSQYDSTADLSVRKLYEWQSHSSPLEFGDKKNVYLGFQGENDNLSRTLEEAMLAKFFGVSAIDEKSKDEWKKKRNDNQLRFSIPNKDKSTLRDIIHSSSNGKTDFMYSVIMNKLEIKMLPNYIREALLWLM